MEDLVQQKQQAREEEEEERPQKQGNVKDNEEDTSDDEFPSASPSESESSEDDEDGEAFDSIDVDFEFFDPDEGDFHGIKTLLVNYLDGREFNSTDLTERVMECAGSTVIKCGEDGNAIGIAAVLDGDDKEESLESIQAFIKDHCPDDVLEKFESTWKKTSTAVVISERLLNCPPQLAPPLMEQIFIPEKGMNVSCYILIGRAYKDPTNDDGLLIFALPEYEFLGHHATWQFSFDVTNRPVGKDDLRPLRFVACVPASAVKTALKEMERVIAESS